MTTKQRVKWAQKEAAVRALEKNGRIDPNALIDAAREKNHPCHGDFTWDVKRAALERWRDQARAIIRRCKFLVEVEEVTTPVVNYVPATEVDMADFVSLPKVRAKGKVSAVLLAEVHQLVGIASRAHGIALSKLNIVGAKVVAKLRSIRDQAEEIEAMLEE